MGFTRSKNRSAKTWRAWLEKGLQRLRWTIDWRKEDAVQEDKPKNRLILSDHQICRTMSKEPSSILLD